MTLDNNDISMEEAMKSIDDSMRKIKIGDLVKGKVISVSENNVIVNIGYMKDGIISKEEFSFNQDINILDAIKKDEEIYVYILKKDDGEGNVFLSKKRADEIKLWDDIYEAKKNRLILTFKATEIVKGGIRGKVLGLNAFMPAFMVSAHYVEDFKIYNGKELDVKVVEVNKRNSKIIVSRKVIEEEEIKKRKDQFWSKIKKGKIRKGTVSKIMNFGAFVDLGEEEGLIHLSELSWRKVKKPSEVVSVGQPIQVYVLDIDKDKQRISLSLKELGENPWETVEEKFKIGTVHKGKVTRLVDFGAFVEITEGVEGLVHLSEITEENIAKSSEVLKIGEEIKVKVLNIDKKNNRIALSIKEAKENSTEDFSKYIDEDENLNSLGDLFKDKLKNLNFK